MALATGQQIGIAGTQPNIGAFVQDVLRPNGQTNYIGCDSLTSAATNEDVRNIPIGTVCQTNYGTTQAAKDAIYSSSAVVLIPTDKVDVTSGVAVKNNATGTRTVFANVPAGGFFWAVLN